MCAQLQSEEKDGIQGTETFYIALREAEDNLGLRNGDGTNLLRKSFSLISCYMVLL
jgi:hypothetical protein